ncbi:alpha/beta fold hydrolase [Albimonas pacifica]|uniref:Pimeloyl-ACP methyl ester carboxylesterase n=1 Tax=Albimonas pacifica TaxID=1114924 RepID=A0A1I3BGP8_9RHOB|nr:alpha/beta fold hydrolase [Albimonas pacifica]SFH60911.1 Pimeloyl-ACP methyl ester carboxylesterase [Albimonas pacifica]
MLETLRDAPEDCAWEIDGLRFAGLAWGPRGGTPVLALHGWMDHGGSFAELAPRLTGCRVVAPDLSGQGLSGHRAAHATYNIWDDLPQLADLIDQLGWEDCVLLGHSRGANISSLLAAALPERVRAYVALDALVPQPIGEDVAATLRAFVRETRGSRPLRSFASPEEYIRRRGDKGNAERTGQALAERALIETPEGYRIRGDARLFASSAVKLSEAQVESVLRAIRCPVLNIWATEGTLSNRPQNGGVAERAAEIIPDYERIELNGDHHFHLDPEAAAPMAEAILDFLDRKRVR